MPNPNSSFSDIIATTLQGYSGKMADNVTNDNALLRQISKKGNKMTATGRSIVQEIEYAENGNLQWFSGAEQFSIASTEHLTAAEFNYKQLIATAVITGLEEIQNSGKEAVHNLLKSRIKNVERTLKNEMARALYYDGTGNDGKEIGGLGLLVAGTPTNTVGGISGSTYSWWQNQVYDFSGEAVTASATTIQHAMNTLFFDCQRGADKPDMIVSGQTYYEYYLESLQTQQRFSDDKGAGAGFTNLMFMGSVPVILDKICSATKMYFLNTDYIFLRPAAGREYKPLGDRASVNQDAIAMPVTWAGNMTVSNRARQGVIQA